MTKTDSTITGKVKNITEYTTWGLITYQASARAARSTEIQALAALDCPALSVLHREILFWEIVGKQPQRFTDIAGLPARALGGAALSKWIAARLGMTWREIDAALEDITGILEEQARAGR